MKEVKYVELNIKRLARFDHEETIPVHYWPSVLCAPVGEKSLLVDLEEIKAVHAPIMHIREIIRERNWDSDEPDNYFELETKDFYICWSPEAEEVIGRPAAEIKRLSDALKNREQSIYKLDREIIKVKSALRRYEQASFWKRLKWLFKREM